MHPCFRRAREFAAGIAALTVASFTCARHATSPALTLAVHARLPLPFAGPLKS